MMSDPIPIPRARSRGGSSTSTPERHRKYGSAEQVDLEALMNLIKEDHIKLSLEDIEPEVKVITMGVKDTITIVHFNDVYNIEPRDVEPVGGAARQTQLIKSLSHLNPLVLFSGDALNPSMMSTVTRGQQMIPVLNSMNVKCAVFGNHDFDFGIDELTKVSKQTNFPWLMSNCFDHETGDPLADGHLKYMIHWEGRKIGLIGLVEVEWIDTLAAVDKEDVKFIDYVKEGKKIAKELREEGADMVIALTHMRWPNDRRLARECPEIDLFLGGHDHEYHVEKVNDRWIIKSGTDFQNITKITVTFGDHIHIEWEKLDVTSSIEEDPEIKAIVDKYMGVLAEKMETVLGNFDVELEGRFSKIRTQETNLGNFICDIMVAASGADFALLNSGTLRSDRIHPRGEFRMKDLTAILPMIDPCVVLKVPGEVVLEALENGVSQYPAHEGRFPQVAGISFGFDPTLLPGRRIDRKRVHIGLEGELLDLEKDYKLCTKHYMALGKDGYDCLKKCEVLVDDEEGPLLLTIVQNHFDSVRVVQGKPTCRPRARRRSITLARQQSFDRRYSMQTHMIGRLSDLEYRRHSLTTMSSMSSPDVESPVVPTRALLTKQASVHDAPAMPGCDHAHLSPEVEGRIYIIHGERKDDLIAQTLQLEAALHDATIFEATDSEERDEGIESGSSGGIHIENQVR